MFKVYHNDIIYHIIIFIYHHVFTSMCHWSWDLWKQQPLPVAQCWSVLVYVVRTASTIEAGILRPGFYEAPGFGRDDAPLRLNILAFYFRALGWRETPQTEWCFAQDSGKRLALARIEGHRVMASVRRIYLAFWCIFHVYWLKLCTFMRDVLNFLRFQQLQRTPHRKTYYTMLH